MADANSTDFIDSIDIYAENIVKDFDVFLRFVYRPVTHVLMVCGLLGNAAAVVTFFRGRTLQTPHFLFYKTLSITELVCNFSLLINVLFDATTTLSEDNTNSIITVLQQKKRIRAWALYTGPMAAFYQGLIYRALASGTGYLSMYMTLMISSDRCIAVLLPTRYRKISAQCKKKTNSIAIAAAVVVSFAFHSWAAFTENQVLEISSPLNHNITLAALVKRAPPPSSSLSIAYKCKDYYNAATRIAYLSLLVVVTIAIIVGLLKIERKRARLAGDMTVTQVAALPGNRTNSAQRRKRIEKSLLCLMVGVVLLAYTQAIPVELRRLLNAIYPKQLAERNARNMLETYDLRFKAVQIYFYGHQLLEFMANLATAIDKSLKFYLYILLNKQMRREALNVCCMCRHQQRAKTGYSMTAAASLANV